MSIRVKICPCSSAGQVLGAWASLHSSVLIVYQYIHHVKCGQNANPLFSMHFENAVYLCALNECAPSASWHCRIFPMRHVTRVYGLTVHMCVRYVDSEGEMANVSLYLNNMH